MKFCTHSDNIPCHLCTEKHGFELGVIYERNRIASLVLRLSHDNFVEKNIERSKFLEQLAEMIASGMK